MHTHPTDAIAKTTVAQTSLLEAALEYASRGWHVFPLCPNKQTPRTGRGFYDATTDPDRIRAWWAAWPDANIGVRTGATSGVFVLAIDCDERAVASLASLESENGPLPETHRVRTGAGGQHFFFRIPDSGLGGRVLPGRLDPGLAIHGDGAYVVAAPSCDETGSARSIVVDPRLADPPNWLLERLLQPDPPGEDSQTTESVEPLREFITGAELFRAADEPIEWLARPCLASGFVTLLSGVKRVGKTTLALATARALLEGGGLLGEAALPSQVVYLTDQLPRSLKLALRRAGLTEERSRELHILFHRRHAQSSWHELAGAGLEKCADVGARVLVVDVLDSLVGPGREIAAEDAALVMQPLVAAAGERGLGILVVEPDKASASLDVCSPAWAHHADHILELARPARNPDASIRTIGLRGRLLEDSHTIEVAWNRELGYELVVDSRKLRQMRVREALYRLLLIEGGTFRRARLIEHPWMAELDVTRPELLKALRLELELGRVEERRSSGRGRPTVVKLMRHDRPEASELEL